MSYNVPYACVGCEYVKEHRSRSPLLDALVTHYSCAKRPAIYNARISADKDFRRSSERVRCMSRAGSYAERWYVLCLADLRFDDEAAPIAKVAGHSACELDSIRYCAGVQGGCSLCSTR